ncbi:class I SAM-dependent methyltransferase [Gallaecimonas sp. GXIMD1310]|uniref:class I SAM-dependent methyltransferase n=1 Tax=Gallaecimonas sp. GXIMD1310 TaxID=3131926 RepID=UPI00324DBF99
MLFRPLTQLEPATMPESWQELKDGEWLFTQMAQQLAPWWPRLYGYYLVKLGPLAGAFDTSAARTHRQWQLGPGGSVCCHGPELPLKSNSVDILLMAHNLEYSTDPHQLMREAQRVLVEGGHLVLTGFSPLSLLRLCSLWRQAAPFDGHYYHPMRVSDWLALLGFEVIADQRLLYGPLSRHSPQWLERLGSRFGRFAAGSYVLVAVKRAIPMTPVSLKRRPARVLAKPVAGAISGRWGEY